MRNRTCRALFTTTLAALAAWTCGGPATARPIYPEPSGMQAVVLRGWGSGMASADTGTAFAGNPSSIKIVTHGYYAGGRILFNPPVDIGPEMNGPDRRFQFLEFIVNLAGGPDPNALPSTDGTPPPGPPIKYLRVVLGFEGATVEATNIPIVLQTAQEAGWYSMAVPIAAFKGIDRVKNFRLQEIRIFGDDYLPNGFNIGEIRITKDDEPIDVSPIESFDVAVNDSITFVAVATAGLSTLKYTWDFDASDGITEDASGPVATHIYTKARVNAAGQPQPYKLTLTVSDISGVKPPVKREAEITVNP